LPDIEALTSRKRPSGHPSECKGTKKGKSEDTGLALMGDVSSAITQMANIVTKKSEEDTIQQEDDIWLWCKLLANKLKKKDPEEVEMFMYNVDGMVLNLPPK
jgi:hypothetical protein